MILQRDTRLEELENRFSTLEPRLADSPEKEAISILHAMILEGRRRGQGEAGAQHNDAGATIQANSQKMIEGQSRQS